MSKERDFFVIKRLFDLSLPTLDPTPPRDINEVTKILISRTEILDSVTPIKIIEMCFKALDYYCIKSRKNQEQMYNNKFLMARTLQLIKLNPNFHVFTPEKDIRKIKYWALKLYFKIMWNYCSLEMWESHKEIFLKGLDPRENGNAYANICGTICLNIVRRKLLSNTIIFFGPDEQLMVQNSLEHIEHGKEMGKNLNELLNTLISWETECVKVYKQLNGIQRINFLKIVYKKILDTCEIDHALFDQLVFELKHSAERLIKIDGDGELHMEFRELFCKLEIITLAARTENGFEDMLRNDSVLFLYLGRLLISTYRYEMFNKNIFGIMQSFHQIASTIKPHNLEREHHGPRSYTFKSNLIRTMCFLLIDHERNQTIVREMGILDAIFACLKYDAKHNALKLYSILAICNACDDNPVNYLYCKNLVEKFELSKEIYVEFMDVNNAEEYRNTYNHEKRTPIKLEYYKQAPFNEESLKSVKKEIDFTVMTEKGEGDEHGDGKQEKIEEVPLVPSQSEKAEQEEELQFESDLP